VFGLFYGEVLGFGAFHHLEGVLDYWQDVGSELEDSLLFAGFDEF
jgi:hypothetical protein